MLAMQDPSDIAAIDEVALRSELPVKPVLAAPSELEDAILRHRPADPGDSLSCADFVNGDDEGPDVLSMQQITPAPHSPDSTVRPLPPIVLDEKGSAAEAAGSAPEAPPAEAAPTTEAAPAAEAAPPAEAASASAPSPSAPLNDLVLRAIMQLLVEKGILSRDELIDRLGALKESDADALGEG
jgi:hypothetical protein